MKTKIIVCLTILMSLSFLRSELQAAKADEKAEFRMGVVDFQQALNGVEEGKKAKAKLKKEFEGKQKDIEKRKADLEKRQKVLEDYQGKAASGLLKPEKMEEGRKLEAEFRKKFEEYTKLVQDSQKNISQKEMDATRGILQKLRDMVVDLGRKEGFSMVLEKNESGLLYAASYTDLTEKLIQTYNKKYKK